VGAGAPVAVGTIGSVVSTGGLLDGIDLFHREHGRLGVPDYTDALLVVRVGMSDALPAAWRVHREIDGIAEH
jgi:hypothetical protein